MQSGRLRNRRQEKGNQGNVPGRDGDNGVTEYRTPLHTAKIHLSGMQAFLLYLLVGNGKINKKFAGIFKKRWGIYFLQRLHPDHRDGTGDIGLKL